MSFVIKGIPLLKRGKHSENMKVIHSLRLWLPVLLLLIVLLVLYFNFRNYLTFEALKEYRGVMLKWTNEHYALTSISFILFYILMVAISIPVASFLMLVAGFLFGIIWGFLYVLIGICVGTTLLFLIERLILRTWDFQEHSAWMKKIKRGVKKNAFSYLLSLRLIPFFPFWVTNLAPALLNIPLRTFMLTTFIGMIPKAFINVSLGNGLGYIFDAGKVPTLQTLYTPEIFLPLLGLAILALLPVFLKLFKK